MVSKGKRAQIRTSFRSVYGNTGESDQNIIRYANEIIFYADKYPFEDEELSKLRFTSINAVEDTDAITGYLARVPDSEFSAKNYSTYARLFEIGKNYGVGYKGKSSDKEQSKPVEDFKEETPTTTEPKVEAPIIGESSPEVEAPTKPVSYGAGDVLDMAGDAGMENGTVAHYTNPDESVAPSVDPSPETKDNKPKNIKEDFTMSENKTAYEQMVEQGNKLGVGTELGANVSGVSKTDREAAAKAVEKTQTARMAYSENAKIKKVLCTQIDRTKKAIDGTASMGRVSDPSKAMSKFIAVTGCDVKEGEVSFSRLHSSELYDNALKMFNLLKEACEHPETPVKPYFGKPDATVPVSMKGIVLDDPDGTEMILQQKDIASHILSKGFLYLNVDSVSKAQFMLDAATNKASTPKRSYVIRVANKSSMLEDKDVCVMVKNITNKPSDSKTGFRSELAVVVNTSKVGPNGEPKKTTWRIPLEVEQYEVEVVDKYSELFKTGLAHNVKPYTTSSAADVSSILQKITAIVAAESVKSADKSALSADMRAAINDERSEMQADDAKSVNESLSGGKTAEDFT